MGVQSEIDRIITAVGNAYSKVSEKGGTLPASQTVANLATAIDSIPAGGGGSGGYATIDELMAANGYTTESENITEDQIAGFKAMLDDIVTQIEAESGYSTNHNVVPYFNDAEYKIAFVIQ